MTTSTHPEDSRLSLRDALLPRPGVPLLKVAYDLTEAAGVLDVAEIEEEQDLLAVLDLLTAVRVLDICGLSDEDAPLFDALKRDYAAICAGKPDSIEGLSLFRRALQFGFSELVRRGALVDSEAGRFRAMTGRPRVAP